MIAGSAFNYNYLGVGQSSHTLVERYLPDGRLDPSSGDGVQTFDFDDAAAFGGAIALAPNRSMWSSAARSRSSRSYSPNPISGSPG